METVTLRSDKVLNIVSKAFNSIVFKVVIASFTIFALTSLISSFIPMSESDTAEMLASLTGSDVSMPEEEAIQFISDLKTSGLMMSIINFVPYIFGLLGAWKIFLARKQKPLVSDGFKYVRLYLLGNIITMVVSAVMMFITSMGDIQTLIGILVTLTLMGLYYIKGLSVLKVISKAAEDGTLTGPISLIIVLIGIYLASTGLSGVVLSENSGAQLVLDVLTGASDAIFRASLVIFLYKLRMQLTKR